MTASPHLPLEGEVAGRRPTGGGDREATIHPTPARFARRPSPSRGGWHRPAWSYCIGATIVGCFSDPASSLLGIIFSAV
jgi:hypothetical protein